MKKRENLQKKEEKGERNPFLNKPSLTIENMISQIYTDLKCKNRVFLCHDSIYTALLWLHFTYSTD